MLVELDSLARALAETGLESFVPDILPKSLSGLGRVGSVRAYGASDRHRELAQQCLRAGWEIIETKSSDLGEREVRLTMAVDAMELCLTESSFDTLIVVSNGAEWDPLNLKLRAHKKQSVGVGLRSVVPAAVADRFDRYLDLRELLEVPAEEPGARAIEPAKAPVFSLLVDTIQSLEGGGEGVIWGSTLKRAMRSRNPEFDETRHGYTTFSDLLEDADRYQLIQLERDDRSGNYYVTGVAGE